MLFLYLSVTAVLSRAVRASTVLCFYIGYANCLGNCKIFDNGDKTWIEFSYLYGKRIF